MKHRPLKTRYSERTKLLLFGLGLVAFGSVAGALDPVSGAAIMLFGVFFSGVGLFGKGFDL